MVTWFCGAQRRVPSQQRRRVPRAEQSPQGGLVRAPRQMGLQKSHDLWSQALPQFPLHRTTETVKGTLHEVLGTE